MFIVNVLPDGGASALSGLQRFVLAGLISEAHQAYLCRMAAQAPYPAYIGFVLVGLISEAHQALMA